MPEPITAVKRLWPAPGRVPLDELRQRWRAEWPRADQGARAMMISSLDGSAVLGAVSGGLSSPVDQKLMDVLRSAADVVVVGAGTLRQEGYGGLRIAEDSAAWRRAQGLPEHPVLAVVSRALDLDPQTPFLAQAPVRPLVLTGATAPADRAEALRAVADVVVAGQDGVDPRTAHALLAERGLERVHTEGGPALLGRWAQAGMIAQLHLSLAPVLTGDDRPGILTGRLEPPLRTELRELLRDGSMLLTRSAVLP